MCSCCLLFCFAHIATAAVAVVDAVSEDSTLEIMLATHLQNACAAHRADESTLPTDEYLQVQVAVAGDCVGVRCV